VLGSADVLQQMAVGLCWLTVAPLLFLLRQRRRRMAWIVVTRRLLLLFLLLHVLK
jgi:hypothetical protein